MAGQRHKLLSSFVLELIRSTVFVFLGNSICSQYTLNRHLNDRTVTHIAWGASFTLVYLLCDNISLPSLTPVLAVHQLFSRQINVIPCIVTLFAQIIGAFLGSCLTWAVYFEGIIDLDKGDHMITGPLRTAHIFGGYPSLHRSDMYLLFDQIVSSFMFVLIVGSLSCPPSALPYCTGLAYSIVLATFDYNSTTVLNPAREIGSRLGSFIFAFGEKVFVTRNCKWLPSIIFGPLIGAALGSWCSQALKAFGERRQDLKRSENGEQRKVINNKHVDFSALDEVFVNTMESKML